MSIIFDNTVRPSSSLFFSKNDANDPRLGEIISFEPNDYEKSDIIIVGCPQDEGVTRNAGRPGADKGPDAIREQFYKLTSMGFRKRVFDAGNIDVSGNLEEIHDKHQAVVTQLLKDGKRVITLGGGNDISYPDGCAMSDTFGADNWIAMNIDAHLDVRLSDTRNSGTPYRQLLDEKRLNPQKFYEVGYQSHFCSPVYYKYISDLGVNRISLEVLRGREEAHLEIKERVKQTFVNHSNALETFFGFDMDAVRMADAPGTSAPSPLGLRAGEFITIVKYAASLANTKIIEFSETNPEYDIDNRTTKLVAIAMHRFITNSVN